MSDEMEVQGDVSVVDALKEGLYFLLFAPNT